MALQQKEPNFEAVRSRFRIAQDGPVPTDIQIRKDYQATIREEIENVAVLIEQLVGDGREKSLALTNLEEALMWAGKAIFKD